MHGIKFSSNHHLKELLLSTGTKVICEASYNTIWGTGITMKDNNCLDSRYWSGTGIQGELLMKCWEELRKESTVSASEITRMDTSNLNSTRGITHTAVQPSNEMPNSTPG